MARSRSGARLPAVATAFLLPVLFSPSVAAPAWTPRAALALVLAAFGLPRLFVLARSDARRAAFAASAFLAVAALASALSSQPVLSLLGLYNWGTGLLFVAALVGAWALGASLDAGAVELVERALIAGVCVNAVVALVQGAFALDAAPFTRYEGRAAGLLSNPVHLATLSAGGLALVLPRVRAWPRSSVGIVVLVAAALQLSGSRFALGLAAFLALVTLVRNGRSGRVGVAALGLGLALGVGIGALGGTTTGAGRLQAGAERVGSTARLQVWGSARHVVAHRPLLGAGPGRFRAATSPHRTLALVHNEGADRRFVDAHNLAVEYAVTTGLLGLAAFAVWLVAACRRARGPLLGFALVVLAMHLVEPQFVGTTPLALLALGAAGRAEVAPARRLATRATLLLVVAAVLAAGRLLWGDFQLDQARLDFAAGPARTAVRALPPWPEPAAVAGRVALYRSITTHAAEARREALRWRRVATRRDPTDPTLWSELGEAQLYFGDPAGARGSFRHALHWDPWSVRALNGLANAALAQGDRTTARRALERSLVADPHQTKARRTLAEL